MVSLFLQPGPQDLSCSSSPLQVMKITVISQGFMDDLRAGVPCHGELFLKAILVAQE